MRSKKTAKAYQFLSSNLVLLSFFAVLNSDSTSVASGQDFLLNQDCVREEVFPSQIQLSIAREFYTAKFYFRVRDVDESAYVTCRVPSNEYSTLSLQLGMEYHARASMRRVSIWLDGNEVEVVNISPDEVEDLLLDVSGVSNIHIEATCVRTCRTSSRSLLYLMEADLQR